MTDANDLKKLIREVPDFPKPGVLFYDITTLLKDSRGFHDTIDGLKEHYQGAGADMVIGIEARGFIFAPALAYALGAGFVPVRKPKNCRRSVSASATRSSTAPTASRFTRTRFTAAIAC